MVYLDTHEAQPQKGIFYASEMTYMSVDSALELSNVLNSIGEKSVYLRINVIRDDERNITKLCYLSLCRSTRL